jgi:tryptophan 2,3-dioxygenase
LNVQDAPIRSRSTIAGPLSGVIEALQNDNVSLATWLVRRYVAILKLFSPMMRVLEFDEEIRIWRFAHARTAQRAIGGN